MRNPISIVTVLLVQLIVELSAQRLIYLDRRRVQNIHNWLRSREGASNMNYLNWDRYLEGQAARWALTCRFQHQYGGRYGENLAFEASSARLNSRRVVVNGLRNWFNEKRLYRFGPQSCGAACHYTQMVWANTDRIGCALSYCNVIVDPQSGRTFRNAMYLVCFYTPQGNIIGQFPYRRGPSCSRCSPRKRICMNGLCQGSFRRFRRSTTKTDDLCDVINKIEKIEESNCIQPFIVSVCPQKCSKKVKVDHVKK